MSPAPTTRYCLNLEIECTQTGEIQNLEVSEKIAGITDFALHCIKVSACRFLIASAYEIVSEVLRSKPNFPVIDLAFAINTLAPIAGIVLGNCRYLFNAQTISNKSQQEERNSFVFGCVVISRIFASILATYVSTSYVSFDEAIDLILIPIFCLLSFSTESIFTYHLPNYGISTSQGQAMGKDRKISQINFTLVQSGGGVHTATVYNEQLG